MPNNNNHRRSVALLACGVIGPAVFVVVFLIDDTVPAIRPVGYNPLRHPVSGFAIGEHGRIQTANFILTGLLLLGFAIGLRAALRRYGAGTGVSVLRAVYAAVRPGYHQNKRHWNTVELDGSIDDDELREMIDHSYELVVRRLPRAQQSRLFGG